MRNVNWQIGIHEVWNQELIHVLLLNSIYCGYVTEGYESRKQKDAENI
jgi:hypothetical protein